MSRRKVSKRERLRHLAKAHPEWTYKQYAEHLGQSEASIRSVLSKYGLSKYKRGRPTNEAKEKSRESKQKRPLPDNGPTVKVFSRAGPARGGYIKLI